MDCIYPLKLRFSDKFLYACELHAGGVFNYCIVQLTLWGAIQAVLMFWSVAYPFSFRQLKVSGRIRHAHIISIVLAVVIPLPAGLIHLSGGVVNITSSVLPCLGRNYTLILPISIIVAFSMSLLLLIIWTLFKAMH